MPTKNQSIAYILGSALVVAFATLTYTGIQSTAPVVPQDASVDAGSAATQRLAVAATMCPEAVRKDARGEPRNAAGFIRWCWPGENKCFVDRDGDAYAEPGYIKCVPYSPVADAGRVDARVDVRDVIDADVRDVVDVRDVRDVRDVADIRDVRDILDVRDNAPADIRDVFNELRDVFDVPGDNRDIGVDIFDAADVQFDGGLVAFPGAEGYGASSVGGRGGRVIYVTNLNTSGAGSLQDALNQSGPRYILFKVSGLINSDIHVQNGNFTLAGQTSPVGIVVRGIDTTEEPYCDQNCGPSARGVSNIIIRHLRSRPAGGNFPDALRLRYTHHVIVDHVSLGNAADECVEVSYSHDITIQNSIFAETLGGHSGYGGVLINYSNSASGYALDNLSFIRNNWNRLQGRYPEFSRESVGVGGSVLRAQLINNLYWDFRYFLDFNAYSVSGGNSGSPIYYALNFIGNYAFSPSSNHFGFIWLQSPNNGTHAYFSDNRINLWPARQDWDFNYCCSDYNGESHARPSWAVTTALPLAPATVIAASAVRSYAVNNEGAFPRDAMDTRLMSFVAASTIDSRPSNTNPAGDALSVAIAGTGPVPPSDADSDGMSDAWELTHGLNPFVQDHNSLQCSSVGYTCIEVYLNELADQRVLSAR